MHVLIYTGLVQFTRYCCSGVFLQFFKTPRLSTLVFLKLGQKLNSLFNLQLREGIVLRAHLLERRREDVFPDKKLNGSKAQSIKRELW